MRFDNIFVPKGNGMGWTLNYDNPVSWVITVVTFAILFAVLYPRVKQLWQYFRKDK